MRPRLGRGKEGLPNTEDYNDVNAKMGRLATSDMVQAQALGEV